MKRPGASVETCNHYLTAFNQFCTWMVKNRRMPDNPVIHLEKGNAEEDRRRNRRDLSPEEIERLLEATAKSSKSYRGLAGIDRFVVYYVALGSGLRASEIGSLKPESFDLDSEPPIVVVAAHVSKHGKRDEQPLQPDLVPILRDYLDGKPAGDLLWPGSWKKRAAEMLRGDLEAAGIPYVDAAGRVADFHAHRHTYLTVAGKSLPPKMAQLLGRHSDYKTTQRYTHIGLSDIGSAAAQLPPLLPDKQHDRAEFRATGTEDLEPRQPVSLSHPCHGIRTGTHSDAQIRTIEGSDKETARVLEVSQNPGKTRGKRRLEGCSPSGGEKPISKSRYS